MMKNLFMVGVAMAALSSCTQNEVLEVNQSKAIGFGNAFVNNGTRSVSDPSLTTDKLPNFDVYGFVTNSEQHSSQIFYGTEVRKEEIDGQQKWTYDNPQYWVKGNTYTFAAIAPSKAGTVTSESVNDGKVNMTVTFSNHDDSQIDLLYAAPAAVSVASDDYKGLVEMTFSHVLSKVKFSFTNSVGVGYSVKVKDVLITNAMSEGTFTVGETNTWSTDEENATLNLNFGNVVANDDDTEADAITNGSTSETYNEKLMIPTPTETSYTVEFTVDLLQGNVVIGSYDHVVTISDVELKSGFCYDFAAVLTHENVIDPNKPLNPIEFTVNETIDGWNITDQNQNLDVPTSSTEG